MNCPLSSCGNFFFQFVSELEEHVLGRLFTNFVDLSFSVYFFSILFLALSFFPCLVLFSHAWLNFNKEGAHSAWEKRKKHISSHFHTFLFSPGLTHFCRVGWACRNITHKSGFRMLLFTCPQKPVLKYRKSHYFINTSFLLISCEGVGGKRPSKGDVGLCGQRGQLYHTSVGQITPSSIST